MQCGQRQTVLAAQQCGCVLPVAQHDGVEALVLRAEAHHWLNETEELLVVADRLGAATADRPEILAEAYRYQAAASLRRGDTRLGVAGKIMGTATAQACLDHGADFVMIGRAASSNPWIFQQIEQYVATGRYDTPPETARYEIMKRYYTMLHEHKAMDAVGKMKQFASWFTHGVQNGAALRKVAELAGYSTTVVYSLFVLLPFGELIVADVLLYSAALMLEFGSLLVLRKRGGGGGVYC